MGGGLGWDLRVRPVPAVPAARNFWWCMEIWESANLEIWKYGTQKKPQLKRFRNKIRHAQNVGRVIISRTKNPPDRLGDYF